MKKEEEQARLKAEEDAKAQSSENQTTVPAAETSEDQKVVFVDLNPSVASITEQAA